jgi:hypothetical protein
MYLSKEDFAVVQGSLISVHYLQVMSSKSGNVPLHQHTSYFITRLNNM